MNSSLDRMRNAIDFGPFLSPAIKRGIQKGKDPLGGSPRSLGWARWHFQIQNRTVSGAPRAPGVAPCPSCTYTGCCSPCNTSLTLKFQRQIEMGNHVAQISSQQTTPGNLGEPPLLSMSSKISANIGAVGDARRFGPARGCAAWG